MERQLISQIGPVVVAAVGCIVLLFPTITNWFSSLGYVQQAASYSQDSAHLNDEERQRLLDAAHKYNQNLPNGPLRDPYTLTENGEYVDLRDGLEEYNRQLNVGEQKPMAWVSIPRIDVMLPVFHGTDDKVLEKGAGHLYGSALPVGGESTHAVITAHSGLVKAEMFSNLNRVKEGDTFSVKVLDEQYYYRVDQVETVDPTYTGEALRQVAGEDYVTLLTCTPTGVNTHRLLVRGARIPAPSAEDLHGQVSVGDYRPDFPWWVVIVIAVPTLVWVALTAIEKKKGSRSAGADDDVRAIATARRRH